VTTEPANKPLGAVGPSTRAIHAGLPPAEPGEPFLPGPALWSTVHMPGDAQPAGYTRYDNPSFAGLERALGELDGGRSLVFASGMAAASAVLIGTLRAGDVLVVTEGAYPGVQQVATTDIPGLEVRVVPAHTGDVVAAAPGAALVIIETPANPRLEVIDIAAVAEVAALLAVDNTLATPVGQRPLDLGADISFLSGTKGLAGHSDVLIGAVSARDPELLAPMRAWRGRVGAIPGPFESWLVHRSLATLDLRMARASENAEALAAMLRERGLEVFHPGTDEVARRQMARFGPLVSFTLDSAERAHAFLAACRLVAEATSFGGVHSTAERRRRWGLDDVPEGFIRFSAGCEDTADLLADVEQALSRAGS
jgi:cystathionine gamma-lyase